MTPKTKHGPNRLGSYQQVHTTVMQKLLREGFVLSDELSFRDMGYGTMVLEGDLPCQGGITISVRKELKILKGSDADALVHTRDYTYNAILDGVGTILRYDSPHQTHNKYHHVHRHDVLYGDREGRVDEVREEDDRPTLGEMIAEVRDWYYANIEAVSVIERRR
jgi:hypothetical protein